MGINNVTIETADARVIRAIASDPIVLDELLGRAEGDEQFPYLRYVDPYGDTIFNRRQMEPFLREWRELGRHASSAEERAALREVEALAEMCEAQPHLYLRFHGD